MHGAPTLSAFIARVCTRPRPAREALNARQAWACARINLNQPVHAATMNRGGEGVTRKANVNVRRTRHA